MGLDVEVQMFHLPSAAPITWNENEFRVPAPNIIATTPGTVTLPPGVSSRAALTLATVPKGRQRRQTPPACEVGTTLMTPGAEKATSGSPGRTIEQSALQRSQ